MPTTASAGHLRRAPPIQTMPTPTTEQRYGWYSSQHEYEHHGWGDSPTMGEIERETLLQSMIAGMP